MQCPKCHSAKTYVKQTRDNARQRKCHACGAMFWTDEVVRGKPTTSLELSLLAENRKLRAAIQRIREILP